MDNQTLPYASRGRRILASIIDSLLIMVATVPLLLMFYGTEYYTSDQVFFGTADAIINYILPLVAVIGFWVYCQATPGKLGMKMIIVDANTGGKPSIGQYIIRYLGYIIATIPLGLGLFWVLWDKRRQGWHDKMAKTVVVDTRPLSNNNAILDN
ncbi:RDD family protein [Thaumasiovibrio subtropicus]|uniref:RDD family protein n=1 Tax=Thaumasiovibrio subtropicus TaxID=1891207 RepID=UPI000B34DAEA|nr:RDD family protein [Thaumasiovibrio subtropicus]